MPFPPATRRSSSRRRSKKEETEAEAEEEEEQEQEEEEEEDEEEADEKTNKRGACQQRRTTKTMAGMLYWLSLIFRSLTCTNTRTLSQHELRPETETNHAFMNGNGETVRACMCARVLLDDRECCRVQQSERDEKEEWERQETPDEPGGAGGARAQRVTGDRWRGRRRQHFPMPWRAPVSWERGASEQEAGDRATTNGGQGEDDAKDDE